MARPQPIFKGDATVLWKQPESGHLSLTDRTTLTDVYIGTLQLCYTNALARGTFGTGDRLGYVLTSSEVESVRGGLGKLTLTWESGGFYASWPVPVDEFKVDPQELYPKTERNKFFLDGSGNFLLTTKTLALAYATLHASTPYARANALDQLNGLADTIQRNLGVALSNKLQRGEETFYSAGIRYTWSAYSYTLPSMTLGGFIQSPLGPLSGYFFGISFLRLADSLESAGVNGSAFKISRTWLGGPGGYWDSDLYS